MGKDEPDCGPKGGGIWGRAIARRNKDNGKEGIPMLRNGYSLCNYSVKNSEIVSK